MFQKINNRTGQFNLVYTNDEIKSIAAAINFKPGVDSLTNLPLIGNIINDARFTSDTQHLYIWSGSLWQDQGDIIDLNWDALIGKPNATPADIDDAVSLKHSVNSLDILAANNSIDLSNISPLLSDVQVDNTQKIAQTFTPSRSGNLISIELNISRSDLMESNLLVEIQGTDINGKPDGNTIASKYVDYTIFPIPLETVTTTVTFTNPIPITYNVEYSIVFSVVSGTPSYYLITSVSISSGLLYYKNQPTWELVNPSISVCAYFQTVMNFPELELIKDGILKNNLSVVGGIKIDGRDISADGEKLDLIPTTGVVGTTGARGTTGAQGLRGTTGVTGTTGARGTTGVTGTTGAQGTTGVTGIMGVDGTTGAQGTTGAVGTTGATGGAILDQSNSPSDADLDSLTLGMPIAQTFRANTTGILSKIELKYMKGPGTFTGDIIFGIQGVSDGKPDGTYLTPLVYIPISSLAGVEGDEEILEIYTGMNIVSGTDYAIVIRSTDVNFISFLQGASYTNGTGWFGQSAYPPVDWSDENLDFWFQTYIGAQGLTGTTGAQGTTGITGTTGVGGELKLTENIGYTINSSGSDIAGDGSVGNPFATIQHALDIIPKNLNGFYVTITIHTPHTEEPVIRGFYNGEITLDSDNTGQLLTGLSTGSSGYVIALYYNTATILIQNLSIELPPGYSGGVGIECAESKLVVSGLKFKDIVGDGYGFQIESFSNISVSNIENYDANILGYGFIGANSILIYHLASVLFSNNLLGSVDTSSSVVFQTGIYTTP